MADELDGDFQIVVGGESQGAIGMFEVEEGVALGCDRGRWEF